MTQLHRMCFVCDKTELTSKLFRCGKCKNIAYCSQECQLAHWPEHKKTCDTPLMQGEITKVDVHKSMDIIMGNTFAYAFTLCLQKRITSNMVIAIYLPQTLTIPHQPIMLVCLEKARLPQRLIPVQDSDYILIGWSTDSTKTDIAGTRLVNTQPTDTVTMDIFESTLGTKLPNFLTGKIALLVPHPSGYVPHQDIRMEVLVVTDTIYKLFAPDHI
jgi:MYND finger protein